MTTGTLFRWVLTIFFKSPANANPLLEECSATILNTNLQAASVLGYVESQRGIRRVCGTR
jgi:hypothetical protein